MGNPNNPGSDPPPAYYASGYSSGGVPLAARPPVVAVMPSPLLGPGPARMTCPHCEATIDSTVEYQANSRTHLFALVLCLLCPFGCCIIPYCVNSCQSATHSCPNCRRTLGTYQQ